MNKQAAEMTQRVQRAITSGKLKLDGTYTIPKLATGIKYARLSQRSGR